MMWDVRTQLGRIQNIVFDRFPIIPGPGVSAYTAKTVKIRCGLGLGRGA